jgi:50S ribosomal subunit-associated GTPase HflX
MVSKVKESWAMNKQGAQKFDVERFNLRMLYELEVRKQYQIKISNKLAALENLNDSEGINRAWENIKENIKTSAKESLCLNQLKQQTKMQWLQDPSQSNINNLNNVTREASRHFRNKKKEYLKDKSEEFETNTSYISGTCLGVSMILIRVTSLELRW